MTGSVDDLRITVVRVVPSEGYSRDTKHGPLVADVKMPTGAVLRTTRDDTIEGTVKA